jgi:hypothetical protein
MIRRHRALLTLLLSLLLFGMQLQGQWHAFEHVGDMLRHSAEHSLVAPVAEACPMCALFAGGANAVACDDAETHLTLAGAEPPARGFHSFAAAPASFYLSRAPPTFL